MLAAKCLQPQQMRGRSKLSRALLNAREAKVGSMVDGNDKLKNKIGSNDLRGVAFLPTCMCVQVHKTNGQYLTKARI